MARSIDEREEEEVGWERWEMDRWEIDEVDKGVRGRERRRIVRSIL